MSVFSQTLQSITATKLSELSKKRKLFDTQKISLLLSAKNEPDQQKRVQVLVDGVRKCFSMRALAPRGAGRDSPGRLVSGGIKDSQLEMLLKNLELFLQQAEYDPSISETLLSGWERSLVVKLKVQSLKYEYASLYGELVTEWLNAEKATGHADDMSVMSEDFEKIETTAKEASRAEWERLVFEPFETDAIEISNYLRNLFAENDPISQASRALGALRRSVKTFESSLRVPEQFNDDVLGWTINGLLASGLLGDEKRAVLKDFLASPVILAEVADVLNMRLAAISTWTWEQEVPIEQRKHVTGAYHIYIDEELLEAIFLQFIGIKWSIFFKEAFTRFFEFEGAWASLREPISVEAKKRREYFLGTQQKKPSVQSKRQGIYRSNFFMSQLPDSPYTFKQAAGAQGEEEARYDERPPKRQHLQAQAAQQVQQQQQMQQQVVMMQRQQQQQQPMAQMPMMQQMSDLPRSTCPPPMSFPYGINHYHNNDEFDLENENDKPKSSIAIKQKLLHLLSTEVLLNTKLHGDFTCTRSEFFSFSPTLPHSTISSVLSFFGLSDKWLSFFHKFLEAPLKFVEDGDDAPTRPRKRGVPGAHSMSAVCGEVILFCLDYAVNQQTNGAQLYRMHDDFWVWSPSHTTVVSAWSAITRFSDVMGLTLNAAKTGTIRIRRDQTLPAPVHESLPRGEIRWGFLYMDDLTGRFMIDQDMVDKHVLELQRQLESKNTSVFSWVQAWNTYAGTFFSTNFGKPANCFGREHVTRILTTMKGVQKRMFGDSNIATYLKAILRERFGVDDVPDGFLYFPASLGGLELQNPFIPLLHVRNAVFVNPSSIIDQYLDKEKEAYRRAKDKFEKGILNKNWNSPHDQLAFFGFEEFTRYREEFYCGYEGDLLNCFNDLLKQPQAETVGFGNEERKELGDVMGSASGDISDYLKWVAQLYGKEMREKFGGLQIVEKGMLPMGMIRLFKSGRVKW